MQEKRPGWYPLGRPAAIEKDLLPLAELHGMLRQVGLLRLRNGVLSPTKAASNDWRTWAAGPSARSLLPRATALIAF